MSRPHLLLVDDSDAILAYETAVLSAHYAISTAKNGQDALRMIQELRPAAVLLDLSMPEMDGDEVLRRLKADPGLAEIPVIIVSSEATRADACLRAGAGAFVPKPIRAESLRGTIGRLLDQVEHRRRQTGIAVLFVGVGALEFGVRLDHVHLVLLQPETTPLPTGPEHVRELLDLHGQPVCVLDLAAGLGVAHAEPVEERKLVVLQHGSQLLALCVDRVSEPEVLELGDFTPRAELGGSAHEPLGRTLEGVGKSSRGQFAVIDPLAVFSPELLRELPRLVRDLRGAASPGPGAAQP